MFLLIDSFIDSLRFFDSRLLDFVFKKSSKSTSTCKSMQEVFLRLTTKTGIRLLLSKPMKLSFDAQKGIMHLLLCWYAHHDNNLNTVSTSNTTITTKCLIIIIIIIIIAAAGVPILPRLPTNLSNITETSSSWSVPSYNWTKRFVCSSLAASSSKCNY